MLLLRIQCVIIISSAVFISIVQPIQDLLSSKIRNNAARQKRQSDSTPQYPIPKCYSRKQSSSLRGPFNVQRGNGVPQDCANVCGQMNTETDRSHSCHAFDFNSRTGGCRFFDQTSSENHGRLIDSYRTDLYELEGSCGGTTRNQETTAGPSGSPGPSGAPKCFQKHQSAGLTDRPFRREKRADSPEECASACKRIHDDENERRTCLAFEFNSQRGLCHFFDKNSKSVSMMQSDKSDLYELDETCWRQTNGPPTIPPQVQACPNGMKPLMEKVTGWYLNNQALAFKNVNEKVCYDRCLQDKTPTTNEPYKCMSVSYNKNTSVCIYLNSIASPLNRAGPALKPDSRYNYYAKMCLPADTIKKCPGYVTRFTSRTLIGMNDAKLTTPTYSDCVKECLTADQKLSFNCLSGMFYNNATKNNCMLNYADHYKEPSLFIFDPKETVDYFSLKSCHW